MGTTSSIAINAITLLDANPESLAETNVRVRLGNTRVTGKEQYYTPSKISSEIMENVKTLLDGNLGQALIEPAGGTGSFIEAAKQVGFSEIISFDIEPRHPLVVKGSFLDQELTVKNAVTVSNPPFGRNNSLSIPFFNHAAKYSDVIVFIVPRSWRKWTVQNKLDRNFHLVKDDDLDINYVDDRNMLLSKKSLLRTCVQYWIRSDETLRRIYKVQDKGVISRCKFDEADASFTLFGYGCGTVKTEFPRKPNTTQMFIKLHHPRALEALQNVDFSKFYLHTAYTEALSMHEINYLINDYIFGDPYLVSDQESNLFNISS